MCCVVSFCWVSFSSLLASSQLPDRFEFHFFYLSLSLVWFFILLFHFAAPVNSTGGLRLDTWMLSIWGRTVCVERDLFFSLSLKYNVSYLFCTEVQVFMSIRSDKIWLITPSNATLRAVNWNWKWVNWTLLTNYNAENNANAINRQRTSRILSGERPQTYML